MRVCSFDINIFESYYAPDDIRNIFDDRSVVESWLMFAGLLAEVQGELGIISTEAAREIKKKATLKYVKFDRIVELYAKTKHPALSIIRALTEVCSRGLGEFVTYGSSAPELWENTLAHRLKKVVDLFERDLATIHSHLNRLADIHRNTIMVERSLGRQALPTTFGFVAAIWSDAISKNLTRIQEARKRILTGFLKGVVGTYASYFMIAPEKCLEMEKRVLNRLGLYSNEISFRRHLERLTEFMNLLVLLAQTFEKIFNDIFFQQRDEIAELEEPYDLEGPAESSTLPQKRNPVLCQAILARCKKIRSNAVAFAETHVQQSHDTIAFSIENLIIPESCILTGDMLHNAKYVLEHLRVYPEVMRRNLDSSNSLVMTEALMLALAKKTGQKHAAHNIIHKTVLESIQKGISFQNYISEHPLVRKYMKTNEIQNLLSPENYLGLINMCIDKVINK